MPSTTTQLISGDVVAVGTPAQIPLLIVPSPVGAVGQVYTFQPGQDATQSLGGGLGADQALYLLRRTNGFVSVVVAAATWSPAPSLTHTGTGLALISLALAAGAPGILDDYSFTITVSQPGTALTGAKVSIAYDGATVAENVPVPTEPPAQIVGAGTAPITPTTLALVNGTALVFDQPASKTLTFPAGGLPAAPAGLLVAAATSSSTSTVAFSAMLPAGQAALAANPRKPTFTSGGATPAHVPASAVLTGLDYAGNTITETVTPSTTAGMVTATKAYASFSVAYSAGGGTDATIAIGYADAYASVAALLVEIAALALAAPLAIAPSAPQTATGTFLALATTATGASATITLDASPGTFAALFGFTAGQTSTGAAAQYPLANTGAVAIFPATNPYVLGDTFASGPVLGPRMSISAIQAAAQAAHDAYSDNPFGFGVVGQPADTAANSKALDAALETLRASWIADAAAPRDIYFISGGQWHNPSPVAATNETNVATNDAATQAAFNNAAPTLGTVAADDVYLPGAQQCRPGFFRRTSAITAAVKRAGAAYLAQDLAEGTVPEAVLVGPDGKTRARNENTATIKLGGLDGPGFSVLRTMSDGRQVKFVPGATRAGPTNRYRNIGDVAVANEAARLIQAVTEIWDGQRPPVDATPGNATQGMITDAEKATRADAVDAAVRPTLLPDTGHQNCSSFTITVSDPPTGLFVNNGKTPVKCAIAVLGEIVEVDIIISLSGTTVAAAGTPTVAGV